MPKISIIIPVYNAIEYLEKCLESILAQEFEEVEAILVNDCSTDKTKDIIEEYIKNYHDKEIHEIQDKISKQKEYMILGLRKLDGIYISEFELKFNENPIYLFRNELNKLVNQELIEIDLNNIRLTDKGLDLANIVWEEFI